MTSKWIRKVVTTAGVAWMVLSLGGCGGGGEPVNVGPVQGQGYDDEFQTPTTSKDFKVATNGMIIIRGEIYALLNNNITKKEYTNLVEKIKDKGWTITSKNKTYPYITINTESNKAAILQDAAKYIKSLPGIKGTGLNLAVTGNIYSDSEYQNLSKEQLSSRTWNYDAIHLEGAENLLEYNGNSVNIGVIDYGFIDSNNKTNDLDYTTSNLEPEDSSKEPHGTHIIGTLGALKNSMGTQGVLSKNRKISAIDYTDVPSVLAAVKYLSTEKSVKVVNLSLGLPMCTDWSDSKKTAIKEFMLGCSSYKSNEKSYIEAMKSVVDVNKDLFSELFKENILFIQSSGNDGNSKLQDKTQISAYHNGLFAFLSSNSNQDKALRLDAIHKSIIVGAYGRGKSGSFELVNYSAVPKKESGESDNFILAPGLGIYSSLGNKKFGFMNGTSMAAPHVSGVAGLVLQANPSLDAVDVRRIILENSDMVDGYKALNAEKAVRAALHEPSRCGSVAANHPSLQVAIDQAGYFSITPNPKNGNPYYKYRWTNNQTGAWQETLTPTASIKFNALGSTSIKVDPVLDAGDTEVICPGTTIAVEVVKPKITCLPPKISNKDGTACIDPETTSALYFNDFSSASDLAGWTFTLSWNSTYKTTDYSLADGYLQLNMLSTDKGGHALAPSFAPSDRIRVLAKIFMHSANNYYHPGIILTDESSAPENGGNPKLRLDISLQRSSYPADYKQYCSAYNKIGVADLAGCIKNSLPEPTFNNSDFYDKWVGVAIDYDAGTGIIEIDINSDGIADFKGVVNQRFKPTRIAFRTYGWYTGHYMRINSVKIDKLSPR